jgi:hypothetical protein
VTNTEYPQKYGEMEIPSQASDSDSIVILSVRRVPILDDLNDERRELLAGSCHHSRRSSEH